ncbi:Alpha-1,6-mannosyl-glycoprotein 2-beta-N-acetylglucosaminyltransferase [Hirschfeldia incana]|nr:Alpha-1,6-mannosyl-glycoprotein 2-beta-N-acetylglucosaminyltransferase [Hirschfeldia incana]
MKKQRLKDTAFCRLGILFAFTVSLVLVLLSVPRTAPFSDNDSASLDRESQSKLNLSLLSVARGNQMSVKLHRRNSFPPRNLDLYPNLAKDRVVIVLYVHNRPQYLRVTVESLSKVQGISETLLIVSQDGYYEEMNKIVESIRFCQVKQIHSPYSPHVFKGSFPGTTAKDCKNKGGEKGCVGDPDQYGNHRSPKIVSLKHHWWWMMNTVWDGLEETRGHDGHLLFIEEDHFLFPNAYRNIQTLARLKGVKCPECFAANLAPSDVKSRGEGFDSLVAERMGNVGYSFNRSVWESIHGKAREFCYFDDYNWDITMWATVFPSFGSPVYTLRGPRTSAVHFGKCGLHQGTGGDGDCIDNGMVNIEVKETDRGVNVKEEWGVRVFEHQPGYKAGFKGWGGWGDGRDRRLCLDFATMYRFTSRDASP